MATNKVLKLISFPEISPFNIPMTMLMSWQQISIKPARSLKHHCLPNVPMGSENLANKYSIKSKISKYQFFSNMIDYAYVLVNKCI